MNCSFDLCPGYGLQHCASCARNLDNCTPQTIAELHSMVRAPDGNRCGSYVAMQKKEDRK